MNRFFTRTTVVAGSPLTITGKDYVASKVHKIDFDKLRAIYDDCLLNKKYKSEDVVKTFDSATGGEYMSLYNNALQTLEVLTNVLGQIKPDPTFSVGETIKAITSVNAYNLEWTRPQLRAIITFLCQIPFSVLADIVQTRSKIYNSATPIFLLGQKIHNKVEYNRWKMDDTIPYATNKMLFDVAEFFGKYPEFSQVFNLGTDDDVGVIRIATVTGKGVRYPFTSFRANNLPEEFFTKYGMFNDGIPETEPDNFCYYNDLPKTIRMMLLQLWIWHPSCRNEHMICDLNDLSAQPEALGQTQIKLSKELPE